MSDLRVSRREVLAGAGMALAGSAFPSQRAGAASGIDAAVAGGATVMLQDVRYALPDSVRRQLAGNGVQLMQLAADPVRQWRGESAGLLAVRTTRLLGVTRWPEFLLVRGLAEESGRRVRYQRFDVASGEIVWLMV